MNTVMAVLWLLIGSHGNYVRAQAIDYLPYADCEAQAQQEREAQQGVAAYAIAHNRRVDVSRLVPTMVCLPPMTYPLRRMR